MKYSIIMWSTDSSCIDGIAARAHFLSVRPHDH